MHVLAPASVAFLLLATSSAYANSLENLELQDYSDSFPAYNATEPLADEKTQLLALDIGNASCEELKAIPADIREAFVLSQLFLQRPGSLPKIIGPDCQFLGTAVEVAKISDPLLTLSEERESLYHLTEQRAIIVTYNNKNTIAYGMLYEGTDPVGYFLDNRDAAQRSAAIARTYADTVGSIDLPEQYRQQSSNSSNFVFTQSSSAKSSEPSKPVQPSEVSQPPQALPVVPTINETFGPTELPQAEENGNIIVVIAIVLLVLIAGVLVAVYTKKRKAN